MTRFTAAGGAVALACLLGIGPDAVTTNAAATDARTLPMQFEIWHEGPVQSCGDQCRTWVSASGAITAETPDDFAEFAKKHRLNGLTIAFDSDGGSVNGALALGRTVRRLGMITTVGKTVDLATVERGKRRARLSPHAYCESMCAFLLLAGVERHVPAEARVMVHQIWLGDRRDDPTAASYSAEDLVVVQRDIGKLAQYTIEMGGSIDLLELALKIPPWEPMRMLSREELRSMRIVTAEGAQAEASSGAAKNFVTPASGARPLINGRAWAMLVDDERPALVRSHPLTVEGDDIGTFDIAFTCGDSGRSYTVTYSEQRRAGEAGRPPSAVSDVEISFDGRPVRLKILYSRPDGPLELSTVASGSFPVDLLKSFAMSGSGALAVETASADIQTAIRVGSTGIARALSQLDSACASGARIRSAAHHGE